MNVKKLKNGIIISCQALPDEPLHSSFIMSKMAKAAEEGGADGIRANGVKDIRAIRKETTLPVIGIIKKEYKDSDVYITPTIKEVDELLETDCEIIAVDATDRPRPNGTDLQELVDKVHKKNRLIMADIAVLDEGIRAEKMGFDLISTTLSGYTNYSQKRNEPDFQLIKELSSCVNIPVIMEGHTQKPKHVEKGLKFGAYAAVIGSIVTRPQYITRLYTDVVKEIK